MSRRKASKTAGAKQYKASSVAILLGSVTPGNWATLPSGEEVVVSWQGRGTTFIRRGKSAPEPMESGTRVLSVRERSRSVVDGDAVADPVGGNDSQRLFDAMPLLAIGGNGGNR